MIPISGITKVFPVIGWPVELVKAPAIYNACPGDAVPFDVALAKDTAIVAERGRKTEMSELLLGAQARGPRIKKGKEMLFDLAPFYMERSGWPGSTAEQFRPLGVL